MAKINEARELWLTGAPWLSYPTLRLELVETKQIPTAATDGKRLMYNPDWIQTLDLDERIFAVGHEVGHNILMHNFRRCGRDQLFWNAAGDFVINGMLRQMGYKVPKQCLDDPKYDGWTTEAVYDDLMKNAKGRGKGKGKGDGQAPKDGHCDGAEDCPEGEAAEAEREAQSAAEQAVKLGKMMGKLPGALERLVAQNREPAIPWQEQLRRWAKDQTKGQDNFTWERPGRRAHALGMYLPSTYGITIDKIATAIDVSGSITDELLEQYSGEIDSIVKECNVLETLAIYCDAAIHRVETFKMGEEVRLRSCGGGGTDFRPVFEWIDQHQVRPKFLIFFTDTYGAFPDQQPPYPVMWVVVGPDGQVPWGEVIRIPVPKQ